MQLSQKSLQNELDDISQMEDYANLLEWDFVLGKEGNGLETRYSLRPVPRKKGTRTASNLPGPMPRRWLTSAAC